MPYKNVMIVAHPDDEILWGAKFLESENSTLVLCLTNGADQLRSERFKSVMQLYKVDFSILCFPDNGDIGFTEKESQEICREINEVINQDYVEKVVTHGPFGEYGHTHHKQVSEMVTRTLKDSSKLYFFDFELIEKNNASVNPISTVTTKALQIYFDFIPTQDIFSVANEKFLGRLNSGQLLLRIINKLQRIINKIRRKFLPHLTNDLLLLRDFKEMIPPPELSDLVHIELMKFAKVTRACDYLGLSFPPRNRIDILLNNPSLYYGHTDRLYMILKYLPECSGRTLSVGCHEFNKFDFLAVPDPVLYETIDLEERYASYGSPFTHHVGDFLSFKPVNLYDDVILFGVLGIPHDGSGTLDNYTMFGKEDEVISKANDILKKGGRLLLGPDINLETRMTKKEALLYWHNLHRVNNVLSKCFTLEFSLTTELNLVLVYKKVV